VDGCYFHDDELVPEQHYLICFECGHCYVTAEDLLRASNEEHYKMWFKWDQADYDFVPETNPDNIFFCAYCTHDF